MSGEPAGAERKAADRILSRLRPEARESARVFDVLPLIALEADAATVMQLLGMPEVLSIRPDREVELLKPPGDVADPAIRPGATPE